MFTVTNNSLVSPVILHAPHGGRAIPQKFLESFVVTPEELEAEKDALTDHHTDVLVSSVTGASTVVNHMSRFAVDVERFPDESEEMNEVGMGALYTHGSRRQEIRRPTLRDRDALMAFFDDYSASVTSLVDSALLQHGRALIIDVHSFTKDPLAHELHADQSRPPLCIGFDPFHASPAFIEMVTDAFGWLPSTPNEPFQGAYVPLRHYRTDPRVMSVMLEIRRDVYMDEASLERDATAFAQLRASLQRLADSATRLGRRTGAST